MAIANNTSYLPLQPISESPFLGSWISRRRITSTVFSYLQIRRDTRISRWQASPCLESISCGQLASPTVEDEFDRPAPGRSRPEVRFAGLAGWTVKPSSHGGETPPPHCRAMLQTASARPPQIQIDTLQPDLPQAASRDMISPKVRSEE